MRKCARRSLHTGMTWTHGCMDQHTILLSCRGNCGMVADSMNYHGSGINPRSKCSCSVLVTVHIHALSSAHVLSMLYRCTWLLPCRCPTCDNVVASNCFEEIILPDTVQVCIQCPHCFHSFTHHPKYAYGDPRNLALIGH